MMRRTTWLLVVLLIVGLFAWLAPKGVVEGTVGTSAGTPQEQLGYAAVDTQVIETGENGEPIYRLNAKRIEQANPAASIQLTEPQLEYQADSGSWRLRAARGELASERQQVEFGGSVEATGMLNGQSAIVIRTEQLSVDMREQLVDSQASVSIDWGRLRLNAHGMHVNLRDGSLKLDSQGHGQIIF